MNYDDNNNKNKENLETVDFVENPNTIAVKIDRSYKEGMGTFQIYECARGSWRINKEKVKDIKYKICYCCL